MTVVLDASYALAITLEDELSHADELRGRLQKENLAVPAHWPFEIANALLMTVRRERMPAERLPGVLAGLRSLGVQVDPESGDRAWTTTLQLARRHRLTVYDAAYLELAARTEGMLASRDNDLNRAARSEGVETIPPG